MMERIAANHIHTSNKIEKVTALQQNRIEGPAPASSDKVRSFVSPAGESARTTGSAEGGSVLEFTLRRGDGLGGFTPKKGDGLGRFVPMAGDDLVICKCEKVTRGDIRKAIHEGCRTTADISRKLRSGRGLCQGRSCSNIVRSIVARELGVKSYSLSPSATVDPLGLLEAGMRAMEVEC